MITIKSYTDLQQSKVLANILPHESADMIWNLTIPDLPNIKAIPYEDSDYDNKYLNIIPAWSLAALLGVLPKGTNINTPNPINELSYCCWNHYYEIYADNPVGACYEMILKLHELKML